MMIEIMYNYNLKMVDSPGGKFIIYANDAKNSLWKSLTKRFNELCYRMSYFQRFWGSFEYLHFFRIYEFRILIVENVLQIEDMLLHTISFISRKNVILHKYSSRTPFSLPHFLTALVNFVVRSGSMVKISSSGTTLYFWKISKMISFNFCWDANG